MAAKRYQVIQTDPMGYDWCVAKTDSGPEADAILDRETRQHPELVTEVVDNGPALHPVFQGIFDAFLASCAEDTVNNGDTLLTVEEEKLEEERRGVEVERKLDRDGRFLGEGSPYSEEN